MNRLTALRTFFNQNTNRPVEVKEMGDFIKACSEAERQEFGEAAAKQLGIQLV